MCHHTGPTGPSAAVPAADANCSSSARWHGRAAQVAGAPPCPPATPQRWSATAPQTRAVPCSRLAACGLGSSPEPHHVAARPHWRSATASPHAIPPAQPNTAAAANCAPRCAAGTLCLQLSCSALYHVGTWKRGTRTWLRRLDHAAIFTLIAGTYTPLCLLALDQVGFHESDFFPKSRILSLV